jgi:hypothetical protein
VSIGFVVSGGPSDGPLDVVDGGWDALLAFPFLWSAVPQIVAVESVDSSCC